MLVPAPAGKSIKRTGYIRNSTKWLVLLATVTTVAIVSLYIETSKANKEVERLNQAASELRQELKAKQDGKAEELRQGQDELKKQIDQKIKDIEKRVQERNARLASEKASQEAKPLPFVAVAKASGGKLEWLRASGIPESQWMYVDYIIQKESGWNPNARNASSGAGGLPQALPYSKTGCAWGDAVCQLKWANSYAVSRYGSWANAYNFWLSKHWW